MIHIRARRMGPVPERVGGCSQPLLAAIGSRSPFPVPCVVAAMSLQSDDVINTNNPSIDQLTGNPTPATVATAAQGMLITIRGLAGTYAQTAGIFGREVYNLDPSEPRTVNGYLVGPLEPGGFGIEFGFGAAFRGIRAGEAILTATDQLESLTPAQKEAIRGYVKTMQAYLFLGQALVHDDVGLPIAVSATTGGGDPAPIVSKAEVYANIVRLLDEAKTHLDRRRHGVPVPAAHGLRRLQHARDLPAVQPRAQGARRDVHEELRGRADLARRVVHQHRGDDAREPRPRRLPRIQRGVGRRRERSVRCHAARHRRRAVVPHGRAEASRQHARTSAHHPRRRSATRWRSKA